MDWVDKYIDKLNMSIPFAAAIIERKRGKEREILVQTRWMPNKDPKYSGTIEIPSGWINSYENVYDALRREVFEETGLKVIKIKPDIKTKIHSLRDDGAFAFLPFCCNQQLKGGKPWIGFIFICEVEDKEPRPQKGEVKDVRWMKVSELKKIIQETPEKIFTVQLAALDFYLNYKDRQDILV